MTLSPLSSYYTVDLSIKCDEADLADNDVVRVGGICPLAGTVRYVYAGVGNALPTTGTLGVYRSAATDINLLTAATVDLTALTVNTASAQTLSASNAALEVSAGHMLEAAWTLTDITTSDDATFCCLVVIEPHSR